MPSGGPLSGDIVDLVRPELRFELRSALHRLFEQNAGSLSLPIAVRFNGGAHRVLLLVQAVENSEVSGTRTAVVLFIEGEELSEGLVATERQASDETVRRLTQELELTQARLRAVREESEAANEELRAANEELQSINEEYRSTSEELETSKEELQSINEELQTVNTELKLKLETISRAHSDLQNLMAATEIGTLFLDSSLRIKRFTERVTELFSITPNDEGRPSARSRRRCVRAKCDSASRSRCSISCAIRSRFGTSTAAFSSGIAVAKRFSASAAPRRSASTRNNCWRPKSRPRPLRRSRRGSCAPESGPDRCVSAERTAPSSRSKRSFSSRPWTASASSWRACARAKRPAPEDQIVLAEYVGKAI